MPIQPFQVDSLKVGAATITAQGNALVLPAGTTLSGGSLGVIETDQVIVSNVTVTANRNRLDIGPVTITGNTWVQVAASQVWHVLG
jgi:hypothetical protein